MLTRQEMFDRAFIGLRSQGFERALVHGAGDDGDYCVYSVTKADGKSLRCAWGWVDPGLTADYEGNVREMQSAGRGLAATLSDDDLTWAMELQKMHDSSGIRNMETRLRWFADKHGLTVPQ